MRRFSLMRLVPLLVGIALLALVVWFWPGHGTSGGLLAWINESILLTLSVLLMQYGVRLLRERGEPRPGSRLRAKLVIGLVGMLLLPTMVVQFAASRMVDRGMDVWFDLRVDTLLERALSLAQGFYERIEKEVKQGLLVYIADPFLVDAARGYVSFTQTNDYLASIREHEGWNRVQLFDSNERLLASVQESGLGSVQTEPLSDAARLAMRLGHLATELVSGPDGEKLFGYLPLHDQQGAVGLLRVEVPLPEGVIQSAREVERDYRTYGELEKNRQSLQELFTHAMLFVTLLVVILAGVVGLYFARRLTAPVGQLAQALHEVTEGHLDVVIPTTPEDELGSLVRSFNKMTQRLKQNALAIDQAQNDLTEALASSRQRQYVLETLLANLQAGVMLVDAGGAIRLINQSMRRILQPGEGWMPGVSLLSACGPRLHEVAGFFEELSHQTESMQREFEIPLGKHSQVHVLARGASLSTAGMGGFSGYLIVMDDISELVHAQRNQAWAEVAKRLAHEIKNPLTPIKLAAERLQRRFRAQASDIDVFDGCTHAIISQVERLQRLIADFTTMARLPQPRIRVVQVDELLKEMRELFSPYRQVEVAAAPAGLACDCDPDQVRQVLINLVDNGLAAAGQSGHVKLYALETEESLDWHVEDTGAGISEESAVHLFEPYFSTKEEGSGLGLSIAKRIAEDHGGSLVLISRHSPTHFCLRLPKGLNSMEQP
ncbi:MAG TPA: ATP-binding protein [Mariprofundaceae bacterium]|nr:ATP-binding protein [Mariprofundaceae bacterium]